MEREIGILTDEKIEELISYGKNTLCINHLVKSLRSKDGSELLDIAITQANELCNLDSGIHEIRFKRGEPIPNVKKGYEPQIVFTSPSCEKEARELAKRYNAEIAFLWSE